MKILKKSIFAVAISVLMVACGYSESSEHHDNHKHTSTDQHEHSGENTSSQEETISSNQIAENVDAEKFKSLIDQGNGLLLDVRTPGEVANGTIEGSTNLNFNSPTFKSEVEKLDKDKPVYVFCASGGRSGNAMNMMKDLGFKEVYNLNGGYMRWPYK
jgi:rhodanese-related sulfurtransferase